MATVVTITIIVTVIMALFDDVKLANKSQRTAGGSRPEAGRKPAGSRTAVKGKYSSGKEGRKKPFANRIRELLSKIRI